MDKNVSIVTSPQSQTIVTSVLSVRHMPDKFNVARFNCSGQNSVSRASKLIMVVNMGKQWIDSMFLRPHLTKLVISDK